MWYNIWMSWIIWYHFIHKSQLLFIFKCKIEILVRDAYCWCSSNYYHCFLTPKYGRKPLLERSLKEQPARPLQEAKKRMLRWARFWEETEIVFTCFPGHILILCYKYYHRMVTMDLISTYYIHLRYPRRRRMILSRTLNLILHLHDLWRNKKMSKRLQYGGFTLIP